MYTFILQNITASEKYCCQASIFSDTTMIGMLSHLLLFMVRKT